MVRLAAIGDIHAHEQSRHRVKQVLSGVDRKADALLLAGDLTQTGRPLEAQVLAEELTSLRIPVVAVLGNHDWESDFEAEVSDILVSAGVHLLDGTSVTLTLKGVEVGFAGTKGFGGGFVMHTATAFGERVLKEFVYAGYRETEKVSHALGQLRTQHKVVLLHYSPVRETLIGEAEETFAFLGTSHLTAPIDKLGADVVFHGHSHFGSRFGRTPGGVPVHNVARVLHDNSYVLYELGNESGSGVFAQTA